MNWWFAVDWKWWLQAASHVVCSLNLQFRLHWVCGLVGDVRMSLVLMWCWLYWDWSCNAEKGAVAGGMLLPLFTGKLWMKWRLLLVHVERNCKVAVLSFVEFKAKNWSLCHVVYNGLMEDCGADFRWLSTRIRMKCSWDFSCCWRTWNPNENVFGFNSGWILQAWNGYYRVVVAARQWLCNWAEKIRSRIHELHWLCYRLPEMSHCRLGSKAGRLCCECGLNWTEVGGWNDCIQAEVLLLLWAEVQEWMVSFKIVLVMSLFWWR